MENEQVQQIVVRAVQQAFDAWAAEHPTLAGVIDRIELTTQSAESLRNSEAYRKAVASYYTSQCELTLLHELLDMARPIVMGILAG